jgi:two-component sensor histidine kinase
MTAIWDSARLRIALESAGVGTWSWNVDTDRITLDAAALSIWGISDTGIVTFKTLSATIHPADLDRVRAAFEATREIVGPYETDFRIRRGNETRWVSARGEGDDGGLVARVSYGVFLDVTVRKRAEELREMVAGELQHRVKNLFAVTQALARMAARSNGTKDDMAKDLASRLQGLSDAQDLMRPRSDGQAMTAPLGSVLKVLLRPFGDEDRVRVLAQEPLVGEKSAAALAMIIHELGTNAIKYGALSVPSGKLAVSCALRDPQIAIEWRETGGPPPTQPRGKPGFGTRMVVASVRDQLGGTMRVAWPPEGIVVTLEVSAARLAA